MKFVAHKNSKILISYYLNDISNVDNATIFLNLKPQRDLIKDFRFTFIKRNLDFQHLLSRKCLNKLRQR